MSSEPRIQLEDGGVIVGEIYKDENDNLVIEESVSGETFTVPHQGSEAQLLLAEGTGTDINSSNYVDWTTTVIQDDPYSFDGRTVTFDETGVYEITADADFQSSNARTNPNLYLERHDGSAWDWSGVLGRSGYIRATDGHNYSSVHAHSVVSVSPGEQIRVRGAQEAVSATCVPHRSMFFIKKLK